MPERPPSSNLKPRHPGPATSATSSDATASDPAPPAPSPSSDPAPPAPSPSSGPAPSATPDSKPLGGGDPSGAELVRELLEGDPTYAVNVDRLAFHPQRGWIVFEFLRCVTVPPQRSHPNRYWFRNARKFLALWRLTRALEGTLYLVNYGDERAAGIRLIEVLGMDESGLTMERVEDLGWEAFQGWFRQLNAECRQAPPLI